jgi:hypothetical protein
MISLKESILKSTNSGIWNDVFNLKTKRFSLLTEKGIDKMRDAFCSFYNVTDSNSISAVDTAIENAYHEFGEGNSKKIELVLDKNLFERLKHAYSVKDITFDECAVLNHKPMNLEDVPAIWNTKDVSLVLKIDSENYWIWYYKTSEWLLIVDAKKDNKK